VVQASRLHLLEIITFAMLIFLSPPMESSAIG
jgi:hypothetical protein